MGVRKSVPKLGTRLVPLTFCLSVRPFVNIKCLERFYRSILCVVLCCAQCFHLQAIFVLTRKCT